MNRSHGSGAPVTFCLILLLSIAFLAPLYHSHDHVADHHPENSDDHILFHDEAGHEGLSVDQRHNGSHLHIKRNIGRTDTHLRFKRNSLKSDSCAATELPVFTEHLSCTIVQQTQTSSFRSDFYDCRSGLSPPTA